MFEIELRVTDELTNHVELATDVADALNKVYNYPNDVICLKFSGFDLTFPLCYVFSDLLDDFVTLINDLILEDEGAGTYGFSQNDFFDFDWDVKWDSFDQLFFNFDWRFVKGIENCSELPLSIKISKIEFISSWIKIFQIFQVKLKLVKFEYKDQYNDLQKITDK